MALEFPNSLHAMCIFDADAAAPAFFKNAGFAAAFTRNGAGDYTLSLLEAVDATEGIVLPVVAEAGDTTIAVTRPNDNDVRVTTLVAGVATDADFSLVVHRMPQI